MKLEEGIVLDEMVAEQVGSLRERSERLKSTRLLNVRAVLDASALRPITFNPSLRDFS